MYALPSSFGLRLVLPNQAILTRQFESDTHLGDKLIVPALRLCLLYIEGHAVK
jgi:hypothetical protein